MSEPRNVTSCFPCYVVFNGTNIIYNSKTGALVYADRETAEANHHVSDPCVVVEIKDFADLYHYMKDSHL